MPLSSTYTFVLPVISHFYLSIYYLTQGSTLTKLDVIVRLTPDKAELKHLLRDVFPSSNTGALSIPTALSWLQNSWTQPRQATSTAVKLLPAFENQCALFHPSGMTDHTESGNSTCTKDSSSCSILQFQLTQPHPKSLLPGVPLELPQVPSTLMAIHHYFHNQ